MPGAELTLNASVHCASTAERQMLFEASQCLGPVDVLLLVCGYPAAWMAAYLTKNNTRFCMRCDTPSGGWKAVSSFVQSGQADATVTLSEPTAQNVAYFLCAGVAPQVRLVRSTTPDVQSRVMATNLPASEFPAEVFVELYHKRWRIEEAFKRLKH